MSDDGDIEAGPARKVPENTSREAGVFISSHLLGEFVQKLADDPNVVSLRIEPHNLSSASWYVVWEYAVLDLEKYLKEIERRQHELLGENATYRLLGETK